MNIKKVMFIAIFSLGILASCGEKKAKEEHGHAHTEEEAKERVEEASKSSAQAKEAMIKKEDSLRKVDSLRQVKEHGHAH
jgi:hypothetical protein